MLGSRYLSSPPSIFSNAEIIGLVDSFFEPSTASRDRRLAVCCGFRLRVAPSLIPRPAHRTKSELRCLSVTSRHQSPPGAREPRL
jgi:hypothetical protein